MRHRVFMAGTPALVGRPVIMRAWGTRRLAPTDRNGPLFARLTGRLPATQASAETGSRFGNMCDQLAINQDQAGQQPATVGNQGSEAQLAELVHHGLVTFAVRGVDLTAQTGHQCLFLTEAGATTLDQTIQCGDEVFGWTFVKVDAKHLYLSINQIMAQIFDLRIVRPTRCRWRGRYVHCCHGLSP